MYVRDTHTRAAGITPGAPTNGLGGIVPLSYAICVNHVKLKSMRQEVEAASARTPPINHKPPKVQRPPKVQKPPKVGAVLGFGGP